MYFFPLPIQILIATRLFLSQGIWCSVPAALPQLWDSRIFYLCSRVLQQFTQGKVKSLPPDVFNDKSNICQEQSSFISFSLTADSYLPLFLISI